MEIAFTSSNTTRIPHKLINWFEETLLRVLFRNTVLLESSFSSEQKSSAWWYVSRVTSEPSTGNPENVNDFSKIENQPVNCFMRKFGLDWWWVSLLPLRKSKSMNPRTWNCQTSLRRCSKTRFLPFVSLVLFFFSYWMDSVTFTSMVTGNIDLNHLCYIKLKKINAFD